MAADTKKIKIAAMADLHMQPSLINIYKHVFEEISEKADVLVLGGDLTDHGYIEEAELLREELKSCKIPVVGVLGNHDFASEKQEEIKKILSQNMFVLGDEPFIVLGVGFAGVKGFGGGFDKHMLGLFGEESLKKFVYEVLNEALLLENSLSKIEEMENVNKKIVVMHYSPVRDTVIGEPEEIFPFLGSSRLAEPIDNFDCNMAIHGHAHFGTYEGKTLKGIPVYNVSKNIVQNKFNKPYTILEI